MTRPAAPEPPAWQTGEEEDRWFGQLARAAQRGDRAARDTLWEAAGHRLIRLARGLAWYLTEEEQEEIAQEAFPIFLALVQEWDATAPGGTGFAQYLFGVFRWRIRNLIREERRARAVVSITARSSDAAAMYDRLTAHGPEQQIDVAGFVAALAPHERQVLRLRAVEGLPMPEIAARLGLTPRSVSRTWSGIRRRLRRFIAA